MTVRQTSSRVCVTAGDRDHNVLDPTIVDCRDVSALRELMAAGGPPA